MLDSVTFHFHWTRIYIYNVLSWLFSFLLKRSRKSDFKAPTFFSFFLKKTKNAKENHTFLTMTGVNTSAGPGVPWWRRGFQSHQKTRDSTQMFPHLQTQTHDRLTSQKRHFLRPAALLNTWQMHPQRWWFHTFHGAAWSSATSRNKRLSDTDPSKLFKNSPETSWNDHHPKASSLLQAPLYWDRCPSGLTFSTQPHLNWRPWWAGCYFVITRQ